MGGQYVLKAVIYLCDEDGEETDYPIEHVCAAHDEREAKAEAFDFLLAAAHDHATAERVAEDDGLDSSDVAMTVGLLSFDWYVALDG